MRKKLVLNSLIILSFCALSFAFFVEFILGHEPCNLCKIERIPYIGTLILVSLVIFIKKWEKKLELSGRADYAGTRARVDLPPLGPPGPLKIYLKSKEIIT